MSTYKATRSGSSFIKIFPIITAVWHCLLCIGNIRLTLKQVPLKTIRILPVIMFLCSVPQKNEDVLHLHCGILVLQIELQHAYTT